MSIVNALAGGKGATASISVPTEVQVDLERGKGDWVATANGELVDPSLAKHSATKALALSGESPAAYHGTIGTRLGVPMGVGLKSSSSSSVAIPLAVVSALGKGAPSTQAVLRCSAEASLASGCSVTGAYDDAASCLLGGINVADNLRSRLVVPTRKVERLSVLIKVPQMPSRRKSLDLTKARKLKPIADSILRQSLDKRPWNAMTLNGLLYSCLLGYDPQPAILALELGAKGSGLSGTGPAVAAVFDPSERSSIDALQKLWSEDGSAVIRTETNNQKARALA